MAYAVEVRNLRKAFGTQLALDDISVTWEEGMIHGLIGRNGSGKTVLFKCICGFMKPTEGEILVKGSPMKENSLPEIGIIVEEPGFIGGMSGFQNLKMLASVKRKVNDEQICEAIRKVGLDPFDKKHVAKYSLGMRHRLGIAQAFMEGQTLLILDEPMNGLDKHGVQEIRKLLLDLKAEGKTVLLSSHYAEDIQALCDTVHEMDRGRIVRIR